jgi:hypothetical protein
MLRPERERSLMRHALLGLELLRRTGSEARRIGAVQSRGHDARHTTVFPLDVAADHPVPRRALDAGLVREIGFGKGHRRRTVRPCNTSNHGWRPLRFAARPHDEIAP